MMLVVVMALALHIVFRHLFSELLMMQCHYNGIVFVERDGSMDRLPPEVYALRHGVAVKR
jgi:hypothetical protein